MGRRIAACAAALALVIVAVAGCGGDDSGSASSTSAAAGPSRSEAAARLLALSDIQTTDPLDARWEERSVQEGVDIELPECIDEEAHALATSARVSFATVSDLHLPSLDEQVTGYAGTGAEDAYGAAVERLDGCEPTFVFEGTPSQGAIAPLDLGVELGDASKAWRTTVTIAGAEVKVTTVQIRRGDYVAALVHTDIAQPDLEKIVGYATTAAAKLDAAAEG
jgi:hypothetical protein